MFKKSLILAITLICFNSHASHDHHHQKIQEFPNSMSPAKIAHDEYLVKKHCEKKEDAAVKYPHTEYCFYGAALGVVMMTGSYLLPTNQETKDNLFRAGRALFVGSGAIGAVSVLNENFHAMMDSSKKK